MNASEIVTSILDNMTTSGVEALSVAPERWVTEDHNQRVTLVLSSTVDPDDYATQVVVTLSVRTLYGELDVRANVRPLRAGHDDEGNLTWETVGDLTEYDLTLEDDEVEMSRASGRVNLKRAKVNRRVEDEALQIAEAIEAVVA